MKLLALLACCLLVAGTASAGRRVHIAIEKDNTLIFDGARVFPLGVAPGPPADLTTPDGRNGWKELADGGICYFRTGVHQGNWNAAAEDSFAKEIAAAAEVGGIGGWVFLREMSELSDDHPEKEARLRAFIARYKDSSGIYFWKNVDEPAWGKRPAEPIIKGYRVIKELDPGRPVVLIHAPRNTIEELRRYNAAGDVFGADIYPVSVPMGSHSHLPNKQMSVVGDYTKRMIEVVDGKAPIFMVLQVTWSGVMPERGKTLVRPTFDQQRYMMYQAIISGAKGLHWFGFPFSLSDKDKAYGWNWTYWYEVLKPLLSEIKKGTELNAVITAPANDLKLDVSGGQDIEYLARKLGDRVYVFAAKREGPESSIKLAGLPINCEADVMFENRRVKVVGGVLTDEFKPNAVHIYKLVP